MADENQVMASEEQVEETPVQASEQPQAVEEEQIIDQELKKAASGQLSPQERFNAKRAELTRFKEATTPGLTTVTDEEIFAAMDMDDRNEQAQKVEADEDLRERKEKRRVVLEEAAKRGITLDADPEIDPLLVQDEEKKNLELQAEQDLAAKREDAAKAAQKEIEDTKIEIEREEQVQRGVADIMREQFAKQEQESQAIIDKLEREDKELAGIGSESFFERQNTAGKIFTALAVGLGAAGAIDSKGRSTRTLSLINEAVDRDLQNQKINLEQKLARKKRAFEIARLRLDQVAKQSGNTVAIAKAEQLDRELKAEQEKIDDQRMLMNRIGQGQAVDRSLILNDKELGRRIVSVPGDPVGKVRIANTEGAATAIRETQKELMPTLVQIKEIKRLSKELSSLDKLDPRFNTRRSDIESRLTKVVGSLRLPYTGPGVLQKEEYVRLQNALGRPQDFVRNMDAEIAKMSSVEDVLNRDLEASYSSGGIRAPISRKERIVRSLIKRNPEIQRFQAERVADQYEQIKKLQSKKIKK